MTIETSVQASEGQELYVLDHGGHITCLGFDVVLDRVERIVIELIGRGALPASYLDNELKAVKVARGTLAAYDTYRNLMDLLQRTCARDSERAVYDLSPQLTGLEGHRVEVIDRHGERRRFIVGKSTGWAPCHLEIKRIDSSGGGPADREYQSVHDLGRVR
jgi:hypothetical protein